MKKVLLSLMMCVPLLSSAQETKVDNFKKTDEVLSELVKKALIVAEKTGDFVIEQTPLLLQEFYRWHITKASLCIFLLLVSAVVLFVVMKKHGKYVKKEGLDMGDPECFFPRVLSLIAVVPLAIFIVKYVFNLAFILIAPKLYLIEFFIK